MRDELASPEDPELSDVDQASEILINNPGAVMRAIVLATDEPLLFRCHTLFVASACLWGNWRDSLRQHIPETLSRAHCELVSPPVLFVAETCTAMAAMGMTVVGWAGMVIMHPLSALFGRWG